MNRLLFFILSVSLTISVVLQGGAAPATPAVDKEVLILPVHLKGDYKPVSGNEFTQALVKEAKRLAPKAHLVIPREADLKGLGHSYLTTPPGAQECAKLCATYGATHLCWLEIGFANQQKGENLTLQGSGRMFVYRASLSKVVLDKPLQVSKTGQAANPAEAQEMKPRLDAAVVNLLVQQLIAVAQQKQAEQMVGQWKSAPPPAAPKASASYQAMVSAIGVYEKAINDQDLMASTQANRDALDKWKQLSGAEKRQIDKEFPGTSEWMNGGAYYESSTSILPRSPRGRTLGPRGR